MRHNPNNKDCPLHGVPLSTGEVEQIRERVNAWRGYRGVNSIHDAANQDRESLLRIVDTLRAQRDMDNSTVLTAEKVIEEQRAENAEALALLLDTPCPNDRHGFIHISANCDWCARRAAIMGEGK